MSTQEVARRTGQSDRSVRKWKLVAGLARKWMSDASLAEIVAITRIDAAWATRLDEAAATLRAAALAQTSRMTARVEQGELDALDGRTMYVLKLVIDLFGEAHDEDPTIPRLVPISLAREFGSRRKDRKDDTEDTEDEVAVEVAPQVVAEPLPPEA